MWSKGQSLIEVVVVIAVLAIIVTALTFATISSLRNAQFAKNQTQATKLAQEGLEEVREARDRNKSITILGTSITSWAPNDVACASGDASIWCTQVSSVCGSSNAFCFFKISSDGSMNSITPSSTFPISGTEPIPTPPATALFQRAIIISDDVSYYQVRKTVTVIVQWKDFSGAHESKLTTILRKI